MVKRMLVDATHPEETRVVVVNGTKLEEFDFETSTKKQLKGNIYLAKVIRIEPSLQAAFVEYGGNRHGFLAFSEIHPDYYQIPVADREAILADQERRARQAEESEGQERPQRRRGRNDRGRGRHSDRSNRNNAPSVDSPQPVLAEADATDLMVTPDQTGAQDDQPMVSNWDHEAAREGRHRRTEENREDAPPADQIAAEEHDNDSDNDGSDAGDDTEERQTLNRDGDFRDSEPGWSDSASDADVDDGEEEEEETVSVSSAEDKPSYAAERQDWPATYDQAPAEAFPVASQDADGGDAGTDNGDAPIAPAEAQDVASDDQTAEMPASENASGKTTGTVETLGGEDLGEEERPRRLPPLRSYKIQEVIKRRQILLVQVVKEERGNKGAALTTYLSLAGRYCVLMPNAGRGGGISRKITNAADRKRMRDMLSELEVPHGMGTILRTAGLERSKPEIKRDYDYLIRLWDNIREVTLRSTAPALIYEEGSLIKRSIRDLYGKDIEDLLIEGEEGYRGAKEFMRQLMPSHAKKVQLYRDPIPLFHRYQVETQLDAMHSAVVQLKSGAYIVINPTEALVAIDVNSGRSTKERNIEETALRTNIEAAEEIARQLRLRDLAGLIVIDFIDMEDQRHQLQVERRMKEAMRSDRARIQIGRISAFGLLELSRQRLRPSLLETSTEICPHCEGTGRIRSTESTVLHVLRAIEEEGIRRRAAEIRVTVPTHVALYLLNQKRAGLAEIEQRYVMRVIIDGEDQLIPPNFNLERSRTRPADSLPLVSPLATAAYDEGDAIDDDAVDEAENETESQAETTVAAEAGEDNAEPRLDDASDENGGRRRRRRRRRRPDGDSVVTDGAPGGGEHAAGSGDPAASDSDTSGEAAESSADAEDEGDSANGDTANGRENLELGPDGLPRRRRRGRRGGRRRRQGDRPDGDRPDGNRSDQDRSAGAPESEPPTASHQADSEVTAPPMDEIANGAPSFAEVEPHVIPEQVIRSREPDAKPAVQPAPEPPVADEPASEPAGPARRGWWTRLTSGS